MTTSVIDGLDLTSLPADEQARLHLQAIWPELAARESYEVRCLDCGQHPARPGPRLFLDAIEDIVAVAMEHRSQWDVFVGVGTRACPDALTMSLCQHNERGSDHISRLKAIWGDFDAKTDGEYEARLETLQSLTVPPDVLVGSGRGLHAYWALTEATTELPRVEAVNKSLRVRFGADNAVDAARILRLAGTYNHKYGGPLPVRLLQVSRA